MKKRMSLLVILTIFLSSCSAVSLLGGQPKNSISIANNGSIVFSPKEGVKNLCIKKDVDAFLRGRNPEAIASEYNITDFAKLTFQNNAKVYMNDSNYRNECQYDVKFSDVTKQANWVEVVQVTLKSQEKVEITKLKETGKFDKFINAKQNSANALLVQYILSKLDDNAILVKDVTAPKDGEYRLIAKPVYRFYHFKDKRLINDYDFSGIQGLSFELVKIN